jgi:hypothetical protein
MASLIPVPNVKLPVVSNFSAPMLDALTDALGINRNVLASNQQIETAWQNLPQLLANVPPELRDAGLMRMCIAVATGLFDSALNYVWNAAVLELREKVRRFGVTIIPQIIDKDFDEQKLVDMRDSELLAMCLKLNLISETGYFMLDQCRDVRNNFSAAHPAIGSIDEYEFINFLNRCTRHALITEQNTAAVDIKELMSALNRGAFAEEQYTIWCERIKLTFEAQREAIFGMLHGIYCDPAKDEPARVNAITICARFSATFSPSSISHLVNRHQSYQAKGELDRLKASQAFFENLKIIGLLSEAERHGIISAACQRLMSVHNGMDNFHNEKAFAERLESLSSGQKIPDTVRHEFVETVVTCAVGNAYGTANSAAHAYQKMINSFSPGEILIMLRLPENPTVVGGRIRSYARCAAYFKYIVNLLKPDSIPTSVAKQFQQWSQ